MRRTTGECLKTKKFYVTTPIYYVNDVPSVGSAYTTIAADIIARFHRLKGDDVFFLTGLDENSDKTVQAAKKLGVSDLQNYVDGMAVKWKKTWKILDISNDDFIRTTEERHVKVVNEFFTKVYEKGDVYKGKYEGLYCEGCEAFVTESDLVDGNCPLHKKPPKKIVEENYFFRLSKYENELREYIEKHPEFIQPESRKHEMLNFINSGLKDISISRPHKEWGIPLPIDEKQKFWVWFDALVNYISASPRRWPADVHLIAKDILKFHTVIWGGMLLSAGYKFPKKVFAHGFLTVDGQKMSKSLGNAIDPVSLSEKYSVDALRYYLFREISFGEDGDFSEKTLKTRFNNELADAYGNFAYRTLAFVKMRFDGVVPEPAHYDEKDTEFKKKIEEIAEKVGGKLEELKLNEALEHAMQFADECNKYFNDRAPWHLLKDGGAGAANARTVLFLSTKAVFALSLVLYPFIPATSEKAFKQLGMKSAVKWGDYSALKPGVKLGKIAPLLKKIEE
ncbi:methionine--tRNA ligase [Candidatus Micrarchaeota archaeon]|nr:methionine--tRNA ligase [Candidatus Micrarchaeota archaeon]